MWYTLLYTFKYILPVSGKECVPRDKQQACNQISDRTTCLTSYETRDMANINVKPWSKCGWCPNVPCSNNNANRCEPKSWLQANSITNYEECLKGI